MFLLLPRYKAGPWGVMTLPLNLNIALAWSVERNCSLYAVNKTHLVSGEYKNDVLCYTRTTVLHFVYFTRRNLLCLPYLMKISNITVCCCSWHSLLHTSFSSFLTQKENCTAQPYFLSDTVDCASLQWSWTLCRPWMSSHLMFIMAQNMLVSSMQQVQTIVHQNILAVLPLFAEKLVGFSRVFVSHIILPSPA